MKVGLVGYSGSGKSTVFEWLTGVKPDPGKAQHGQTGVTRVPEVRDLLGPGTEASMPEVVHALANGASEVVISPVAGGSPARLTFRNADSNPCMILRCRSNGTWTSTARPGSCFASSARELPRPLFPPATHL